MLNHKSTRSARLFWLGALLGAAVFLLVYGLAPLDAANDAFCRGGYIEKDIQQHYAGWLFYRSSALGWPLGVTQAINAPQGVSVAYTDSIPLLAVLCRPLAAALGGTFQYFGWFTLVCFALQGGFAALLCGLFAEGLPPLWRVRLCLRPARFYWSARSGTPRSAHSGLCWRRCTVILSAADRAGLRRADCLLSTFWPSVSTRIFCP